MSTPDSTAAPAQPASRKNLIALLLAGFTIGISFVIIMPIRHPQRPQLDLTNTGTNTVTIAFEKTVDDVAPGHTWHARFKDGDRVTFRPQGAAPGAGLTVTLDKRTVKGGLPPRVTAEVNADVAETIRFEYK